MDWKTMMSELATVVEPVVKNYIEIAAIAPPEYKDVADSMVVHETAISTCARLEASGDTEHSLDDVIKELKFSMKSTSRTWGHSRHALEAALTVSPSHNRKSGFLVSAPGKFP